MGYRAEFDARLVVQRELVDDVGACPIIAYDLDGAPPAAQTVDDLVESADAGDIPEMRRLTASLAVTS